MHNDWRYLFFTVAVPLVYMMSLEDTINLYYSLDLLQNECVVSVIKKKSVFNTKFNNVVFTKRDWLFAFYSREEIAGMKEWQKEEIVRLCDTVLETDYELLLCDVDLASSEMKHHILRRSDTTFKTIVTMMAFVVDVKKVDLNPKNPNLLDESGFLRESVYRHFGVNLPYSLYFAMSPKQVWDFMDSFKELYAKGCYIDIPYQYKNEYSHVDFLGYYMNFYCNDFATIDKYYCAREFGCKYLCTTGNVPLDIIKKYHQFVYEGDTPQPKHIVITGPYGIYYDSTFSAYLSKTSVLRDPITKDLVVKSADYEDLEHLLSNEHFNKIFTQGELDGEPLCKNITFSLLAKFRLKRIAVPVNFYHRLIGEVLKNSDGDTSLTEADRSILVFCTNNLKGKKILSASASKELLELTKNATTLYPFMVDISTFPMDFCSEEKYLGLHVRTFEPEQYKNLGTKTLMKQGLDLVVKHKDADFVYEKLLFMYNGESRHWKCKGARGIFDHFPQLFAEEMVEMIGFVEFYTVASFMNNIDKRNAKRLLFRDDRSIQALFDKKLLSKDNRSGMVKFAKPDYVDIFRNECHMIWSRLIRVCKVEWPTLYTMMEGISVRFFSGKKVFMIGDQEYYPISQFWNHGYYTPGEACAIYEVCKFKYLTKHNVWFRNDRSQLLLKKIMDEIETKSLLEFIQLEMEKGLPPQDIDFCMFDLYNKNL